MDNIDITKNCITTECGHCFHASCVMRNVARNGFACPMCRTAMAEEPDDDEDSEFEEETIEEDTRNPDDFALRGFRMFMDNLEGVAHDHEDELEEQEDMEDMEDMYDHHEEDEEDVEEEPQAPKPSAAYITQKLQEQGTTMEDLVKILLRDHDEYDDEDDEFESIDERVWGDMRVIIDNYQPQSEIMPETPVVEQIHPNVTVRQRVVVTPVSEEADIKLPTIRHHRPGTITHLNSISRVLFVDEMEE